MMSTNKHVEQKICLMSLTFGSMKQNTCTSVFCIEKYVFFFIVLQV